LFGLAVNYRCQQWSKFVRFLEDGRIEIDNNRAERSVKPFVTGRNAWLFANTPRGAGARLGLNMISAVIPKGQLRFMAVSGRITAAEFCEFLGSLVHRMQRKVFLVSDGHPLHRSAKVRELAESLKGKLELYYLPHYPPELNPDESVWHDLKSNGIGRMQVVGAEYMKRQVISPMKWMQ
jgi:transposase